MLNSKHAEKANEVYAPAGPAQFPARSGLYYVKPILERVEVKPTKKNPTRMYGTMLAFEIQHMPRNEAPDPDISYEDGSPMNLKTLSDWRQVNDLRQVTSFDKGERRNGTQGEDKYPDNNVGDWVFQEKVTEVPNLLKFITILKAFPLYADQGESLAEEIIELQEEAGVTQELVNSKVIGEELAKFYTDFGTWFLNKLRPLADDSADPGILKIKLKPGSGDYGPSLGFAAFDYGPSAEKLEAGVGDRFPWKPNELNIINGVRQAEAAKQAAEQASSTSQTETAPLEDDGEEFED